ncbi:MAG: hypothetical protein H6671_10420 [Anaerolineaceae bacterium]|nr:hypothetical protein [Anaerolineaceae bacterium]
MEMVEIVVKVPKEFVEEAQEFGLLDPDTIAQVLRDELDERIMRFVDAEVKAHRAERRAQENSNQDH